MLVNIGTQDEMAEDNKDPANLKITIHKARAAELQRFRYARSSERTTFNSQANEVILFCWKHLIWINFGFYSICIVKIKQGLTDLRLL